MSEIAWSRNHHALGSVLETVGRTPLVRLHRVAGTIEPELFVKFEWYGPSGSLKDRI